MAIKTITVYPSGYVNSASASFSNIENGYTSVDSTTYGQINLTTGSGATTYFYYTFDLSEIPSYATITSVECTVKAMISTTSTSYIATSGVRLCTNDTGKGEWADLSTTASTISIVTGEWTRAELDECMVWLYAQRGSSGTSTTRYIRFYGATLTVTYNEPEFTPIIGSTNINGVSKDFITGYANVGGVYKELVKSYGCINGTWLPMWGMKMTYGMMSVGDTVTLNVNGVPYEWIVVHQGLPTAESSTSGKPTTGGSSYDSSCEGTWLLMKDIYELRAYDADTVGYYNESDIHTYLNNTFLGLLDANVQNIVKEVNIPVKDDSSFSVSAMIQLATKVFLLSNTEVGSPATTSSPAVEGVCLDYFVGSDDARRIAYYNGATKYWWLRTKYSTNAGQMLIDTTGSYYTTTSVSSTSRGVRPAMIMPSDAECGFAIGGISTTTYTWKKYNVNKVTTGYSSEQTGNDLTIYIQEGDTWEIGTGYSVDQTTAQYVLTDSKTVTYEEMGIYDNVSGYNYLMRTETYSNEYKKAVYYCPFGVGGSSVNNNFYSLTIDKYEIVTVTTDTQGDYITDVTSTNAVAYPTNGVHSDGYWYVLQ